MKLACTALAIAAALLVAGCGSSGGEAKKSADQILADAQAAAAKASSVHVSGSGSQGQNSLALDLYLAGDKGARGHLKIGDLEFDIIRVGQTAYFKGDAKFWSSFGNGVSTDLLKGKWLSEPTDAGDFTSFVSLTDISKLINGILGSHGTLTKGATSTIGGQPVIALNDTSKKAVLYVRTSGPAYPVKLVSALKVGTITFGQWDEPVTVSAPAKSYDFTKLKTLIGG